MKEGTGLEQFAKRHPDRFYDVGIAEQHAVTFAAGLATQGLKPVVAIYSTFLQRAYDEIIHDVCLQNLPVIFAIDRAGIVGEDGPTHQGTFDLSYLRHIPNIVVMEPKDETELKSMLKLAVNCDGPVAVRYPRGTVESLPTYSSALSPFRIGEAEILKDGKDVALVALGRAVYSAQRASEKLEKDGISAMVINARFIKPLDRNLLSSVFSLIPRIVTIEENALQGGFGSAVLEFLNEIEAPHIRVRRIGIPDVFIEQGQQSELRRQYGLDDEGIYLAVHSFLKEHTYTY
jgi:1-deoxy-D-xylulose-5-phosphate synthase